MDVTVAQKMRDELAKAVAQLVRDFESDTGMNVVSIDVLTYSTVAAGARTAAVKIGVRLP